MVNEIKRDTVDYRDPTPFDNTKLNPLSDISRALRHKTYGKDTREAIAQQGEALVKLMTETGGNQSAEVVAARGKYETLGIHEDAQDNTIAETRIGLDKLSATKLEAKDIVNKVDNGGLEQITLPMLSQDVKKAITGGSVAIVGKDAVSTSNIANNAVTSPKAVAPIQHPQVMLVTDPPDYNTSTHVLTFPAVGPTGGNSVITYGDGAKTYFIPNDGEYTVVNPLPEKTTKLIFDFATNTMSFVEWGVKLTRNQAVLLIMRDNGKYVSSNVFPITVDGKMAGIGKETNSSTAIQVSKDAPIRCIAHRGYSNDYPEDTLAAYRGAKKAGINEVEMDLSWTSDIIPVNIHDSTINRTARHADGSEITETIVVAETTLKELKSYDYGSFLSPKFAGEQIPTLEETLIQCKRLDQVLNIDRFWGLGDEKIEMIKRIIDKVDYHDVVFYINNEDALNRLRNIMPKADAMHLLLSGDVTQESIDLCKKHNLSNARGEGRVQILAKADGVTQAQVEAAVNADVRVNVWAADNVDRKKLMDWGVTGFSTNYVNMQEDVLK
ncbi:glycerophosphodiester phosphodiesterase [Latilactobacillus sakei]|uniref:glycerophosphodiester phosphodiesterase n=1 Tax=Latilactobacillus sakei TaxID=1599 RepID=UPI000B9D77B5|nr:glycerophosphodiester phosphodiesterase family protein [Latilactobacillus sakei]BAX67914.1 glycerophosphoryl diester phosphodiesterase [Latilactobacillus sakei]